MMSLFAVQVGKRKIEDDRFLWALRRAVLLKIDWASLPLNLWRYSIAVSGTVSYS